MHFLVRDGIKLCYELVESEGPALLFIHGWCCDRSFFAPQIDYFAKRGHRIIAVDLRGHGESDKPRQAYTMPVFADDVAWLCDQLGIAKAGFIGHSMGGIVAFELGLRRPDLAAAIVMVDSSVARPPGGRAGIEAFLEKLRGTGYRDVLSGYVTNVLALPTDDRKRLADILATMTSAPQHVMVAAYEGLRDYDPAASGRLAAPALFIAADEPAPRSDMARLKELIPQLAHGRTVGSGHFCQLQVPDQVNAMIARFLALN